MGGELIISKVGPTELSEERRNGVISYIQNLIRTNLGCHVFPYGSVPLKTYLPHGDIDLTVFVSPSLEEHFANHLLSILQSPPQSPNSPHFIVEDVQLIRAEVKIVKCIVQNIVVDISFNQLGGLATLCFLEQVDRLIGKDHLFKQSIILVKAWCYYESRILGAHHALLSTYALETLVLYIFHLFHSKLHRPLPVLFTFLDYFSNFDWDNYCIGLNGPLPLSSLPDIQDNKFENADGDLLLTDEFLKGCIDMFSVPSRPVDNTSRTFLIKHLNIIDPLRSNNNLGRSVSKGNLFRIRSAFAYGARKLGQALSQEEDDRIAEELSKFFLNTLERHGNKQRPDVQDLCGTSFSATNSGSTNGLLKCDNNDDDGVTWNKNEIGCSVDMANNSKMLTQKDGDVANGSAGDIESRSSGDAKDLASSKLLYRKIADGTPQGMVAIPRCAPHLYFSGSKGNGISSETTSCDSKNEVSSVIRTSHRQIGGCYENSLRDLSGDYKSHFNSLKYGRFCCERSSGVPAPSPPPLPHQWASPYKRNGVSNVHTDNVGMIPRQGFHPNDPVMLVHPPAPVFSGEDFPKHRGTGTYIPNVNRPPYRYHLMGRGEMSSHGAVVRSHHSPRNTSWTPYDETIMNTCDAHLCSQEDKFEVDNVPYHDVLESSSTGGHQIAPSTQNLPPPPPPPPSPPKEWQSSSPVCPVSSKDTRRLLMENSVYRLKNEDDFPPLSV